MHMTKHTAPASHPALFHPLDHGRRSVASGLALKGRGWSLGLPFRRCFLPCSRKKSTRRDTFLQGGKKPQGKPRDTRSIVQKMESMTSDSRDDESPDGCSGACCKSDAVLLVRGLSR